MTEHAESDRSWGESGDDDAAEDDAIGAVVGTRGKDASPAQQQQWHASTEDVGRHARGRGKEHLKHEETGASQASDRPMQGACASRATAMAVAREVQKEVRRKDPSLDTRPRTSRDDPEFMRSGAFALLAISCADPFACDTPPRSDLLRLISCSNFFKASRLHYIGTWKARYQQILESLPPPPPLPPPLRPSGERVILHIDMDCFFCSVAVRGRPEFKGMPVAVCWSNAESDKASHGEISSVSGFQNHTKWVRRSSALLGELRATSCSARPRILRARCSRVT